MALKAGSKSKRRRWQLGSYFAIPLEQGYGFGRITGESVAAFYALLAVQIVKPEELDEAPVLSSWLVSKRAINSGRWPIIGHRELESRFLEPVKFIYEDVIADKLYLRLYGVNNNGEEVPVTTENLDSFERNSIHGWWDVEERLANHFAGRPCPHAEGAKYKPDRIWPIQYPNAAGLTADQASDRQAISVSPRALISVFDHDDATDWMKELAEGDSVEPIVAGLRAVIDGQGYLQIDEATIAVAAAEVVATAAGQPVAALPDELARWVARHRRRIDLSQLKPLAKRALNRVREKSELIDQWSEAGLQATGLAMLDALASRLK